jgi:hypothetical protein
MTHLPLDPTTWLALTADLTATERSYFLDLCLWAWAHPGEPLPADPVTVMQIARCASRYEWRAFWKKIALQIHGGPKSGQHIRWVSEAREAAGARWETITEPEPLEALRAPIVTRQDAVGAELDRTTPPAAGAPRHDPIARPDGPAPDPGKDVQAAAWWLLERVLTHLPTPSPDVRRAVYILAAETWPGPAWEVARDNVVASAWNPRVWRALAAAGHAIVIEQAGGDLSVRSSRG